MRPHSALLPALPLTLHLVILCSAAAQAQAQPQPPTVSICVGLLAPARNEAPASGPGNPRPLHAGWSQEVFAQVFERMGMRVRYVEDLPWARCLKTAEAGKIDFALGAYYDANRAKTFAFSRHYITLTPQVFYRALVPPVINHVADLKRHKGCGVLGASYLHYGLAANELDQGVNNFENLFNKLRAGRCDYVVEELEVVADIAKTGVRDPLSDPDLRHSNIAGAKAPTKHLVAGKGSAAEKLLPRVDEQLNQMAASGELLRLRKKYDPDAIYNP